jgi:hypothetical protein
MPHIDEQGNVQPGPKRRPFGFGDILRIKLPSSYRVTSNDDPPADTPPPVPWDEIELVK